MKSIEVMNEIVLIELSMNEHTRKKHTHELVLNICKRKVTFSMRSLAQVDMNFTLLDSNCNIHLKTRSLYNDFLQRL